MSTVGWYVHHHGAGHLTRFTAIRPHLEHEVVVFSSLPAPRKLPDDTTWVVLARDDDDVIGDDGVVRSPRDADPTARGLVHWAPLGHPGHTSRLAAIAAELASRPFAAFVVDVSAEVALFVRLLGVPPVVMTQPGDRSDAPHRLAYDAAERIIAPWPSTAHPSPALERVAERVVVVGGISRFAERIRDREPVPGSVLVLGSSGDADSARDRFDRAETASPEWRWSSIGLPDQQRVDDPWELLQSAEVVVSAAGQNSVADLAAVGARAVVIPQERPFGEQVATGAHLGSAGLAVVEREWPAAPDWTAVLERARTLAPTWEQWQVRGAARRAAAVVDDVIRGRR